MKDTKNLLNIYGAKVSKNGERLNVTLVRGEGDKKEFFTACVKFENAKTLAQIKEGYAYIKIPILQPLKANDTADDLPF